MTTEAAQRSRATAETVARHGYGKLVAFLAARTRDVASAEDALADAFAAALADWPRRGVPRNPEAWLLTVARRRLIDAARRRGVAETVARQLPILAEGAELIEGEAATLPDERLLLLFACAHPALDPGVRAPLMLQTVLGFDAATIGSAFLVSPAAMGQRLVRAKAKIRLAGIPLRMPEPADLAARLDAVLQAIYAAYANGWTDASGTDAQRRNLAEDAIWLCGLVARLSRQHPEALGLMALLLHLEARRGARRGADGEYVPLSEQDPALWDAGMIAEAEALLRLANGMGMLGRFQLEAAIQSAHAGRLATGKTDWPAIVQLYASLHLLTDSPVVAVNRAVAEAAAHGAEAGLARLAALAGRAQLAGYQPYWAALADLLAATGAVDAADAAYLRAIGLEEDGAVRRFLQRRRAKLPIGAARVTR